MNTLKVVIPEAIYKALLAEAAKARADRAAHSGK